MHSESARAGRLPEAVVVDDANAVPAGELRGEAAALLAEDLRGDQLIGLPAVADLSRLRLGVAAPNPVHFIWSDPCRVLARKKLVEALAQQHHGRFGNEVLLDG